MTKFAMKIVETEVPVFTVPELITMTEKWGKDHWSLLAYFECRVVDNKGVVDLSRMRINDKKRGFTNGSGLSTSWNNDWATRMKDGSKPDPKHDDYDVMEELEKAGFIQNIGTGINPVVKLTEIGRKTCNTIREHKSNKGNFNDFTIGQILKVA